MVQGTVSDHAYMARALELARQGLYTTMPNPRVGCVLVREGKIVGEGFHERPGEPHAEIHALRQAGEQAKGATAYVTLEPCSHYGRTPPCANALIEAGVQRVVAAMQDPNPKVAGRGLQMLEEAGIETTNNFMPEAAREVNPGFIQRMETGRPFVRAKLAMSLDGRTAMASGESQWITGPSARSEVQRLRAQACAIVTGVESILQDDSALTVRPGELNLANAETLAQRQPLRVVLDANLRTPCNAKVVQGPGKVMIACSVQADPGKKAQLEEAGAEVLALDSQEGRVNLEQLLQLLAQRECNEVLLETGATLAGSMVQQGLVDELILFMAPTLLGSEARPLLEMPLQTMSQKLNLQVKDIRAIGKDWKITATVTNTAF